MIADFKERCEEVYRYWNKHMPMMVAEECAELIKAISKFERHSCPETTKDLVDEMGDVIISIEALRQYYQIPEEWIEDRIIKKLNRRYDDET